MAAAPRGRGRGGSKGGADAGGLGVRCQGGEEGVPRCVAVRAEAAVAVAEAVEEGHLDCEGGIVVAVARCAAIGTFDPTGRGKVEMVVSQGGFTCSPGISMRLGCVRRGL